MTTGCGGGVEDSAPGGEPPLPPSQSDEVVLLDSQLLEADEVIAPLDEANTQKSKRRKRTT